MIKLDTSIYDQIKDEYFLKMSSKIKSKFDQYKSDKLYFESVTINDFFATDNNFDLEKVRKLIMYDFVNLDKNESIHNNYYKTGCLIAFIDDVLDNADEIKRYVEKYKNIWINEYLEQHPNYFENLEMFKSVISNIEDEYNRLSEELEKIIYYKLIDPTLRHRILVSTGISVCPYCNRQYISSYDNEDITRTTADLDHFYPKAYFVLFALSLYNFVPSCPICNSKLKGSKRKKLLYPFEYGFGNDAKFEITLNSETDANTLLMKNIDFDLVLNTLGNNRNEIDNNKEIFHLEEIYQFHKRYVQELLFKKNYLYSQAYFNSLNAFFNKFNFDEYQRNIILYGYTFNEELDKDRILYKLTKDIVESD